MKEFLLLMSAEHEEAIIAHLGMDKKERKEVKSMSVERIKAPRHRGTNHLVLRRELGNALWALLERETFNDADRIPRVSDVKRIVRDLDGSARSTMEKLKTGTKELEGARLELEKARSHLIEAKAKLATLQALKVDELKKCLAVGVVRFKDVVDLGFASWPRLEEHLQRYKDVRYNLADISPREGLLLVFGPEERRAWVEALFLVFEVKDIFEVLNVREILLALDPSQREDTMRSYEDAIKVLQDFVEREVDVVKARDRLAPVLGEARLVDEVLSILLSQKPTSVGAVCVVAGEASEETTDEFKKAIALLEKDKTCAPFLHLGDQSRK